MPVLAAGINLSKAADTRALEEGGSWGGWSDLLLLLIDRINDMECIILLHFLIMLKSIPCLTEGPLLEPSSFVTARLLLRSQSVLHFLVKNRSMSALLIASWAR